LQPSPGQGALAVECRADDAALIGLLGALDDVDTRAAVSAERALLAALEAGCTAPVGALAEVVESLDAGGAPALELSLRAVVAAPDGSVSLRRSASGAFDAPEALGAALAAELLDDGAADLVTAQVVTADHERPPTPSPAPAPNPAEHSPERAS
jgi:hydroxymethylbilane synthase